MGKILVTASHFKTLCAPALKRLQDAGCEVILNDHELPYYSFEELTRWTPEIDAAIIGMDQWNEAVFETAPNLKILVRFGVGIDNIDLDAAKAHNVKVVSAKGLNANAVAELGVAFILDALRSVLILDRELHRGNWTRAVGHEIKDKTVGLLGFGDISGRIAKKLGGFDVRLMTYDPYPDMEKVKRLGVQLVEREELLTSSDILSIHLPVNPSTYHTMDQAAFAQMKQGAIFINTARGALVDTAALCDAVQSGHLSGAAVDVYENEPIAADARILHTDGIICTPHTGAETFETYRNISDMAAQAILDVFAGKDPINWINP